ncbi:MAG: alpha/beta fold hydrolase [Proteobacteria bacterium]|nr:alpha/beta fold hydrolase [Pseudomonadota bacterium]
MRQNPIVFCAVLLGLLSRAALADDADRLLRIDHYVPVTSTAPSMPGQVAQLYVREVVLAGTALRKPDPQGVLLFVHGAGTPAEVAFDPSLRSYSWMAYLARAGFDVFSVDMTGYGRSTRPLAMNDACNAAKESRAQFVPRLIAATCSPSRTQAITTIESDWHDIDAAVDYVRALRQVDKVSLLGWSQGGPRTAGYTARNPGKVAKLVVLAPAYNRAGPAQAPSPLPTVDGPMSVQTQAEFKANWDRQLGCPGQYDPNAVHALWADFRESDPVGATWGTGVRRAPQVPTWGFNQAVVARMQTPFLMVVGSHDKQVLPERVRELYADLGSKQKVFIELACASHNAMWEKPRELLFKASLDWLRSGTVNGVTAGELKLGD